MEEIDYDKISSMVADKLSDKKRPNRDDVFIKKLVSEMVEHRSPCHNLDNDEVKSMQDFIGKERKRDKGRFLITWGIILYILKSLYDLAIVNIHWGGK